MKIWRRVADHVEDARLRKHSNWGSSKSLFSLLLYLFCFPTSFSGNRHSIFFLWKSDDMMQPLSTNKIRLNPPWAINKSLKRCLHKYTNCKIKLRDYMNGFFRSDWMDKVVIELSLWNDNIRWDTLQCANKVPICICSGYADEYKIWDALFPHFFKNYNQLNQQSCLWDCLSHDELALQLCLCSKVK